MARWHNIGCCMIEASRPARDAQPFPPHADAHTIDASMRFIGRMRINAHVAIIYAAPIPAGAHCGPPQRHTPRYAYFAGFTSPRQTAVELQQVGRRRTPLRRRFWPPAAPARVYRTCGWRFSRSSRCVIVLAAVICSRQWAIILY